MTTINYKELPKDSFLKNVILTMLTMAQKVDDTFKADSTTADNPIEIQFAINGTSIDFAELINDYGKRIKEQADYELEKEFERGKQYGIDMVFSNLRDLVLREENDR